MHCTTQVQTSAESDTEHDVEPRTLTELNVSRIKIFVQNMSADGPFKVVTEADPHWYNRLLIELGLGLDDDMPGTSKSVTFYALLLAMSRLRFSSACLS